MFRFPAALIDEISKRYSAAMSREQYIAAPSMLTQTINLDLDYLLRISSPTAYEQSEETKISDDYYCYHPTNSLATKSGMTQKQSTRRFSTQFTVQKSASTAPKEHPFDTTILEI